MYLYMPLSQPVFDSLKSIQRSLINLWYSSGYYTAHESGGAQQIVSCTFHECYGAPCCAWPDMCCDGENLISKEHCTHFLRTVTEIDLEVPRRHFQYILGFNKIIIKLSICNSKPVNIIENNRCFNKKQDCGDSVEHLELTFFFLSFFFIGNHQIWRRNNLHPETASKFHKHTE